MTLRAWTNLAHRRGYLLEGSAHGFLVNRGAAPGDTLLVYRSTELSPPVSGMGLPGLVYWLLPRLLSLLLLQLFCVKSPCLPGVAASAAAQRLLPRLASASARSHSGKL